MLELGQFAPHRRACDTLQAGQVGYLICNIKSLSQVHIGDTVSIPGDGAAEALPGYQEPKRMVFCGLYPSDGQDFEELRNTLNKLSINDPSFEFEPETSDALGFGFRCGFLGLLHMEIIQQRLGAGSESRPGKTAPTSRTKSPPSRAEHCGSTIRRRFPIRAPSKNSASRSCASASCCRSSTSGQ